MPHQCTECGFTFPDGSKEMLSGCPDCGGNKFQYHPDAVPDEPPDEEPERPPERPDAGVSGAVGRAAETVRDVFGGEESSRDDSSERTPNQSRTETEADASASRSSKNAPETEGGASGREDRAQADARSQVVDEDDLPDPEETSGSGPVPDAEETGAESGGVPSAAPDDAASSGTEGVGDGREGPADADREGTVEADAPGADEQGEQPELSELREELNSQFESIRIVEPGQYELNLMELYDRDQYIIALQEDGRYVIEVPEAWREE